MLGGEQVCEGEAQARAQVERSLAPLAQLLSGAQWYSDDLNLVLASPGAGVRWLPREAPAAQLADAAARLAALRIQIERGSPLPGSFPAHQAQQAAEVRAASQGNRAERRAQLRRQWDERQNAGRQKKD